MLYTVGQKKNAEAREREKSREMTNVSFLATFAFAGLLACGCMFSPKIREIRREASLKNSQTEQAAKINACVPGMR